MGFFKKIFGKKKGGSAVGNFLRKVVGKPVPKADDTKLIEEAKKNAKLEIDSYIDGVIAKGGVPDQAVIEQISQKHIGQLGLDSSKSDSIWKSLLNTAGDYFESAQGRALINAGESALVGLVNKNLEKPIAQFAQTGTGKAIADIGQDAAVNLWWETKKVWLSKNWGYLLLVIPGGLVLYLLVKLIGRVGKR